jgi:hypothetical protein
MSKLKAQNKKVPWSSFDILILDFGFYLALAFGF